MASVHHNTPHIVAVGSRGLPARSIEYLRSEASMPAVALISRQRHDTVGRPVEQWDPRLFGSAPKPNQTSRYNLAGAALYTDSVDAGWRLALSGLAGEVLQNWDERGSHWRATYDRQLRPIALEENGVVEVDSFTYADATADPGHNLRGQLLEHADPSGTLSLDSFDLFGQPLRETRTFNDGQAFVSRSMFSPLGEVLEQTDAGAHRQQSGYDLAGQLTRVSLLLQGQTEWQPVLASADYNAAGQVIRQETGNAVASHWAYDETNGLLLRQASRRRDGSVLLDFEYAHDPMGNITGILDHAFTPSYFSNQRVDGHRAFSYDSLYRLLSASGYDDGPPLDLPGRPQPTDPANRLNYTQTYTYDTGGNLIKLRHVRDGATHTRETFIDPASNRGVRWAPGSPDPAFDTLFDRHGNLQALQPGQDMHWNARDQLASITLVERGTGPNDEEFYRYSQGSRVFKRHETHTAKTSHFSEVRYLPGLEIRTRDNGEKLHVIVLSAGFCGARCLHWKAGKPTGIDPDQLRFSLEDHLGSCAMELDQQAQLISHEGYYPFGATAWMTARSTVEVGYRTLRYSGKEMDVSGLYDYGARYYAPWLQRWISADPAGDVDGLNLYGFVGNNPVGFVDSTGEARGSYMDQLRAGVQGIVRDEKRSYAKNRQSSSEDRGKRHLSGQFKHQVVKHLHILAYVRLRATNAQQQILNHRSGTEFATQVARRTGVHIAKETLSYGVGIVIGSAAQALGLAIPGAGNVIGAGLGFLAKTTTSLALDFITDKLGLSAPIKLKASALDPKKIIQDSEYKTISYFYFAGNKLTKTFDVRSLKGQAGASKMASSVATKVAFPAVAGELNLAVSTTLGAAEIIHEAHGAAHEITAEKEQRLQDNISGLIEEINTGMAAIQGYFESHSAKKLWGFKQKDLQAETSRTVTLLQDTSVMLKSRSKRFTAV